MTTVDVLCFELVPSLDVISPGLTHNRADLQLNLSTALSDQIPELICTLEKHEEVRSNLVQSKALRFEALQFFGKKFPKANVSNCK
ncbi:unnamed protein product [Allacma fusca]|uniref:Uncharacterized protein n=1 Tax=Allacma fusca TaxID=39272 RepID=A0A8J2NZA4_9HEXA|nr:unnamed protein product [Allacma fusca]